jgi:hypothetical protein
VRSEFDRLRTTVGQIKQLTGVIAERPEYPAASRRADLDLGRRLRVLGSSWVVIRLGSVTATPAVLATGTHTFGTYATGGEAITYPDVPGFLYLIMPGRAGYTFQWSATKMIVHDPTGVEVADTTDLSSVLVSVPYLVVGEDSADRAVYRACGAEALLSAGVEIAADVASDSSNYHELTMLRRAEGQSNGDVIGLLSTADRSVGAQAEVTIYDSESGLPLSDGDKLTLRIESVGSPDPLEEALLWLKIRRKV